MFVIRAIYREGSSGIRYWLKHSSTASAIDVSVERNVRAARQHVGLGFPGESLSAEDAAEVDANLDRGDGAERQLGRGIAKVMSPISLETGVSLKPLRELGNSRSECSGDRH